MSVYMDASFLAGLFIEADVFASRATKFFAETTETIVVSDFAAAEFASVVARLTRMNRLSEIERRAIFRGFDAWHPLFAKEVDTGSSDIDDVTATIRRLDLNIRAPDAINLAITLRLGASIGTCDRGMANNARALGITGAAA